MVVAATLVTVTTILLGGLGFFGHRRRWNEEWSRLRRVTAAQCDELAVTLGVPIWNFDHPLIERMLDSQSNVMPIEGIIVHTSNGRVYARVRDARRKFIPSSGSFSTAGLLMEQRPIEFEGERVGTVRIYTTKKLFEQQLRAELWRTVLSILAVDLLLILTVYLLLWRTVLRPIVEIERYAGAVSAEGTTIAPRLQPAPTVELESLRTSIESMVGLLERRYAELQESMAQSLESEERFRTIFESVNDAIIIYDSETGAILDVNNGFSAMLGYTRDEAVLQSSGSFASDEGPYRKESAIAIIRDLGGDDHVVREWQARRKDGEVVDVEISLRLATIGGVRRAITVARDITRRKKLEAALRQSETMSAMGGLVAGVAHEVRNPLFGMSALLDAYANEMTTPDLEELAAGLRQQITRLTHLTRELLEFGRPVAITPVPDSLSDLVREVVQSRTATATAANVRLLGTIDPAMPLIPMDRPRVRQVFENLIDNALQHAPPVQTIRVDARVVVRADQRWLVCTVEDDGEGFRPEDIPHVFEPFFTRRERGTGLGLSIVQRIVGEHGGRVTAGNRAEGGAVIALWLPAN